MTESHYTDLISGGLHFLSKVMSTRETQFYFGARKLTLDKDDLIQSYINELHNDSLGDEYDDIHTFSPPVKFTDACKEMQSFLETVFNGRINNSGRVIYDLMDYILFETRENCGFFPDEFYMCDYQRSYSLDGIPEREYQSGKTLFIPSGSEFLVLHFHAIGKDFQF